MLARIGAKVRSVPEVPGRSFAGSGRGLSSGASFGWGGFGHSEHISLTLDRERIVT